MNHQEIFNTVVNHARKQKKKAIISMVYCKYRTPEGLKGFIGCLIPDELYNSEFESRRIFQEELLPIREYLNVENHLDVDFLSELQKIHDNIAPEFWEDKFVEFSKKFQLNLKHV